MLTRPTIENVRAHLKDGNYTRAATIAKNISKDDPLVSLLADELRRIGNKKPGQRGPRVSEKMRLMEVNGVAVKGQPFSTATEIVAAMQYDYLMLARNIADGRVSETDELTLADAKAVLNKWSLANVPRGRFRIWLREKIEEHYNLSLKKIPR